MSIFRALVLGVVQGLTEFLPISSSGHLVIFPEVFGWDRQSLVFDTTLHLATSLSLLVFFWKDIVSISTAFFNYVLKKKSSVRSYSREALLGLKILVASIPVGIIGFFFEDYFENIFRGLSSVIVFLILGSLLMYFAEGSLKKRLMVKDELSFLKSFKVGLFQVLSLMPGVSRSGSTISGGMIFGLSRKEAARFSFLVSIPVVMGAGIYKLITSLEYFNSADLTSVFVGFGSSFLVGIFSINFMLRFVRNNKLYPFIFYRMSLAFLLIILSVIK
jgi:undecaprenyl-diphosphatase